MSIDITLKFKKPITIEKLIEDSISSIKEILSIKHVPFIAISKLEQNVRTPLTDGVIDTPGSEFIFKFENSIEIEVVDLIIFYAATKDYRDKELLAGLSIGAVRTPLDIALAAGIAISLGRFWNSQIIDEGCLLNPIFKQSANDFAKRISINGNFKNIQEASSAMYQKMPLS